MSKSDFTILDISATPTDNPEDKGTATRVCTPALVCEEGASVVEVPADTFIGPCRVVSVNEFITGASVDAMFLHSCERVLFKGDGKASVMTAAAEALVDAGVKVVGIDSEHIATGADAQSVYTTLLGAGCCILEGLDMSSVTTSGDYFLIAPPVAVSGAVAPVRAVLVDKYIAWNKPQLFGL